MDTLCRRHRHKKILAHIRKKFKRICKWKRNQENIPGNMFGHHIGTSFLFCVSVVMLRPIAWLQALKSILRGLLL